MGEGEIPAGFYTGLLRKLSTTLKAIYEGNAGKIDSAILESVGALLESNVSDSFGKGFADVDFSTPDAEMLTRLTRNVWQFSAAKNYQQMRDMTLALTDADGKLRTFTEFKKAATAINDRYNNVWLNTEYVSAIGGATMAARWAEFKQNADIMPYLQYSTVGDARVRDEHTRLNGVIRKIDDNFWKTHFPPNGWRCRCGVDQLPGSTAVETQNLPDVPVAPLFKTNLAQNGLVFPAGHPYYNGVPKDVLRAGILSLPENVAYKTVYDGYFGKVRMHILHGIGEAGKNVNAARFLADNNHDVELLPVLDKNDNKTRQIIFGEGFIKGRNPDAKVDGKLFEFKVMEAKEITYKNLQREVARGHKQAKNVFIVLPQPANANLVFNAINGLKKQSKTLDQIWVKNGSDLIKY